MNKQEKEDLIQALYDIGGCEAEDEWTRGYDDGVNAAIEVIKELKVHGKVIFSHEEKFVADWLNDLRGQISDVQLERYYDEEYSFLTEKIESWLTVPKNKVKLMSAIDNGYEVEKQQLYYVFDTTTKQYLGVDKVLNKTFWLSSQNSGARTPLTEQEIKAIDERYWPFAVKVGNE